MSNVARKLRDGSVRILAEKMPKLRWHQPSTRATPVQWTSATGVSRYEWARQKTPKVQRPFFEHLRRVYDARPPRLLPPDLVREMRAATTTMQNGMEGLDDYGKFKKQIEAHEIHSTDPTGEWWFQICAEIWRGALCDRIGVSCRDYVTMPDWEMIIRLRSWILDDDREALIWLPDQDTNRPGWEGRYENARFNNLQLISPRRIQPDGTAIPSATQTSCDPDDEVWICADCGSRDVSKVAWVRANSNTIGDDYQPRSGTPTPTWCESCRGAVDLVTLGQYKPDPAGVDDEDDEEHDPC